MIHAVLDFMRKKKKLFDTFVENIKSRLLVLELGCSLFMAPKGQSEALKVSSFFSRKGNFLWLTTFKGNNIVPNYLHIQYECGLNFIKWVKYLCQVLQFLSFSKPNYNLCRPLIIVKKVSFERYVVVLFLKKGL